MAMVTAKATASATAGESLVDLISSSKFLRGGLGSCGVNGIRADAQLAAATGDNQSGYANLDRGFGNATTVTLWMEAPNDGITLPLLK